MAYLQKWRDPSSHVIEACRFFVRSHYETVLKHISTDCPLCQGRAKGGRLCAGCYQDVVGPAHRQTLRCGVCSLVLRPGHACPDCAQQAFAFERVIAAFDYSGSGALLIQQFKAGRRFAHARFLGEMVTIAAKKALPVLPRNTILVPVPASRASIIERGFNPAAEIARYLGWQLQLSCRPGLLRRHEDGVRQKDLSRSQRRQHAAQLYSCPVRLDNASIAIVDDVLTTGSTLDGIARQFRAAGAHSVCGLVVARTPYR